MTTKRENCIFYRSVYLSYPKKLVDQPGLLPNTTCVELVLESSHVIVNYKFNTKNHFSGLFYLKQEIAQTLTF